MTEQAAQGWLELVKIMRQLRSKNGCPWDKEQTHHSLKRYLLEESYEVLDAIDTADDKALCDELGDVLLQVVFHAQIAAEEGRFSIEDVLENVNSKMKRRHPHVFGESSIADSREVLTQWEAIKADEKTTLGAKRQIMKLNDNLPALLLAQKVQDKAGRVGFDWPDISGPWQKVYEELEELKQAENHNEQCNELGDTIFALVNLARFLKADAEDNLRHSIKKFVARFNYIENCLAESRQKWEEKTLAELDALWEEAKMSGL
ncbi:MAG: nucleoside triphosphate pyrophosphohydrolase [Clostridiales bacterium]|nr:nucleoside triphosphate pyrophosphohydrolase [Clostridiales bacterium]